MMTGASSDAQSRNTIWKDVSKEDFILFAQFAYTGDYSVLKPVAKEPNDDEDKDCAEEQRNDRLL
jgi:hypothetical protein